MISSTHPFIEDLIMLLLLGFYLGEKQEGVYRTWMPPTSSDAVNRYFSVKRGKSGKVQNQT
jgi:hypothetical protein